MEGLCRAPLARPSPILTGRSHFGKNGVVGRDNPAMPPRAPASILVAEDQTDIRDLLVMNLRGAGYAVQGVGDGVAALAARTRRPATC